jgi:hypothetical protein
VNIWINAVDGHSIDDFDKDKAQFENTDKLAELNERYRSEGRILGIQVWRSPKQFRVEYTFKDKVSFLEWNRIIVSNGYFQRELLPAAKYVMVGSED